MKDIKNWLRALYVNEPGVAEEIELRIENLKTADKLSGNTFNEKEFRDYLQQQQDMQLDSEEFEPNI